MSKITLNPLITDIRNKMGNMVFSKWKGVNYVRELGDYSDAKTSAQQEVRNNFIGLVNVWKKLGAVMKESWNSHVEGKDMTGYNAFIGDNFQNMKNDLELILSQPLGEEPLSGFSAAAGEQPGEVECSFAGTVDSEKKITIFTKKKVNGEGETPIELHEMDSITSPLIVTGLDAGQDYSVYAVITDSPLNSATKVSQSVSVQVAAAG